MNSVLWIIQALLALLFLLIGGPTVFLPRSTLQRIIPLAMRIPTALRWIGISELLGAIGLLAPGLTGIAPWLTVAAALGLVIVLIGALVTHIRDGEFSHLWFPALLLLLTLFVALGRGMLVPL
jgi:putative oxidoreductase